MQTLKTPEIEYPPSDGKPMAETDVHRNWMFIIISRLQRFFAGRKVYVSGNLLIYYVEGNPRKSVAPDVFVVKNCQPRTRDIFQIWKERKKPSFVLENTSKTTRKEDARNKKTKYALIGVKEYFLYDPFGEWLTPPLQGFRLVDGDYEIIPPDAESGVTSKELGIRFILENGDLAMFDAASAERLLTDEEWQKRRADDESRLRELAEQRLRAVEEELARLKESASKTNGHSRKNGK